MRTRQWKAFWNEHFWNILSFRLELPTATYNILQEDIDLTLSLSVSDVEIVRVWCKTNKGSNWPIWQELLLCNNGLPLSYKRAAAMNCHIHVARGDHFKSQTLKYKVWAMSCGESKSEARMCNTFPVEMNKWLCYTFDLMFLFIYVGRWHWHYL